MAVQTYKVDQAQTFNGVAFLSCEPRLKRGTTDVHDTNADGTRKWDLQIMASFKGFGDKTEHTVLKVGCVSDTNPAEGLTQFTPVELVGFEVGFMARNDKDGNAQGTIWHRCSAVRSLFDTNASRRSAVKAEG